MALRRGETSLSRTPATFAQCDGAGAVAVSVVYGTAVCETCGAIVQVDDDGTTRPHEVRVFAWDDETDDEASE